MHQKTSQNCVGGARKGSLQRPKYMLCLPVKNSRLCLRRRHRYGLGEGGGSARKCSLNSDLVPHECLILFPSRKKKVFIQVGKSEKKAVFPVSSLWEKRNRKVFLTREGRKFNGRNLNRQRSVFFLRFSALEKDWARRRRVLDTFFSISLGAVY